MEKKLMFIVFLGVSLLFSSSAFARYDGDYSGGRHDGGYGMKGDKGGQCPVAGKFMKKAHFLLEHQSDLGLTDEQVKTIKDIKLQVEKASVLQHAEKKIFKLDLRSKLGGDKVDVAGANTLIDKNFTSMAAAAKSNVEAYAKLKDTLTPDQVAKMKELWKNKKDSGKYRDK